MIAIIPNLDDFSHLDDLRVLDQLAVERLLNCDAEQLTQMIVADLFPYPRRIAGRQEWVVGEIRRAMRHASQLKKDMTCKSPILTA